MSCGHWQSEYDASPCSYCEIENKAHAAKDERIKELEEKNREWARITGYEEPDALDFALGRLTLDVWLEHTKKALKVMGDIQIASQQREACAQYIEQASLKEGRPVHAERCRATPLVKP